MINYIVCRNLIKELSCTHYFCLFNRSKLQRFHRSLRLSYNEYMLNRSFLKCNCPVRTIISYRCRNYICFRKFRICAYFCCSIQRLSKLAFYTLSSISICKYIGLNMFFCSESLIDCCTLLSCKYPTIILIFKLDITAIPVSVESHCIAI